MANPPTTTLEREISRAKTPEDFHRALRGELARFNALQESVQAQSPVPLACCAGCSLCCYLRVDARPPEIFLLADFIRSRFSPAALAALMERLARHSAKILALTPFEHVTQNCQCPMLENGCCTVYAVRPQACRRYHSEDLAACQFSFDHPEDIEFPGARNDGLFRALGESMGDCGAAYEAQGFDNQIYELGSALFEALTSPSSWRRWRDKKRAFLQASLTPSGQ